MELLRELRFRDGVVFRQGSSGRRTALQFPRNQSRELLRFIALAI